MEIDEVLHLAWKAVEKADIPERLHEAAFREAVDFLRSEDGARTQTKPSVRVSQARKQGKPENLKTQTPRDLPDEGTFFSTLTAESGVPETDLRDILILSEGGLVQVTTPTKDLGKSATQQARSVIALVAGARAKGLGEQHVKTETVRDELNRKHVYDRTNFAGKHLGPMKGFNAISNTTEIVLTSKWVGDFTEAVNKATGRKPVAKENS